MRQIRLLLIAAAILLPVSVLAQSNSIKLSSAASRVEARIVSGITLSSREVQGLTRQELMILRNAAYARHGRRFVTPELQRYFDACPWYQPRSDYRDSMLTRPDQLNISLLKQAEGRAGDDQQESESAPSGSIEEAMRTFIYSLQNNDPQTFLTLFSHSGVWQYRNTTPGLNNDVRTYTWSQLENNFRRKGELYREIFDCGDYGCFRSWIMHQDLKSWIRQGNRYVHPNSSGRVFVKWRNEEGQWVIEEIAEPQA